MNALIAVVIVAIVMMAVTIVIVLTSYNTSDVKYVTCVNCDKHRAKHANDIANGQCDNTYDHYLSKSFDRLRQFMMLIGFNDVFNDDFIRELYYFDDIEDDKHFLENSYVSSYFRYLTTYKHWTPREVYLKIHEHCNNIRLALLSSDDMCKQAYEQFMRELKYCKTRLEVIRANRQRLENFAKLSRIEW